MSEEEKTEETTEEEPKSEAAAESPEPEPAGEEPNPTPPAEEAPEPAEEPVAEEAPPEEAEAQPAADPDTPGREAEDVSGGNSEDVSGSDMDLPWKERARLERSRQSGEATPERSPEERAAARLEVRRAEAAARRRYRSSQRGKEREPADGTPPAEKQANPAKTRQGVVVSDRADKTITVRIDIARRHPTYEKVVRRSRTLHAHDERNEAGEGDIVRVVETRPLSRTKRWRLVEVVEKAK